MATALPPAESAEPPKGSLHVSLWVGQVLLACAFGAAGVGKATAPISELALDMPWVVALPVLLVRLIGVAEVAGGLGLVLPGFTGIRPALTPLAALGLALIMLLAAFFHLSRGEMSAIVINAVLGLLSLFVAWGRARRAPLAPR